MTRWAHIRAALVAFHLLAITLSGLPSPEGGLNRKAWADPTVQTEFRSWAARFGMKPKDFEDKVWAFASGYQGVYDKLLVPVRPYEHLVGSEQSWKMFVAPHRFPTRLELSARAGDGEWQVLFEEGSSTATWNEPTLRLERLRASIFRWGWPAYSGAWARGCTALAGRAFADFPDKTQFRCRFWKAASPSPEEAAAGIVPEGKWVYTRLVDRGPDGEPKASVAAGTEIPAAPSGGAP